MPTRTQRITNSAFTPTARRTAETEFDFINKRVDGTSYTLEKPLTPGSYTVQVVAYNGNDIKLAESADDIKFTVTGEK